MNTEGDRMTENTTFVASGPAVACSLSEEELARRSREVGRDLFDFAEQVEELSDGFTWRFPGDDSWHEKLLDFVTAERRCCGFFRIELTFEPGLGPVTLTLRGPEGTKAFIAETFLA
jgi:hypothetical protein